jgi:hypothetical protein
MEAPGGLPAVMGAIFGELARVGRCVLDRDDGRHTVEDRS